MKKFLLLLIAVFSFLIIGCEVEFSPNAEWKDVPVVYCLLDQDDDTIFARVEKCFLGEGSIYQYGAVSDSLNYPEGAVRVTLFEHRPNGTLDSSDFLYTTRNHQDGVFANSQQPVYYSTRPLNEQYTYSLQVRRTSDNSLLASTDPIPLIRQEEEGLFIHPSNQDRFKFLGRTDGDPACHLEWYRLVNGRRYQPNVRFYYAEEEDTLYVDLRGPVTIASTTASRVGAAYSRSVFLADLKEALKDDPNPKRYIDEVDIYLTACDENLNVYLHSIASGSSAFQTSDTYTNIHGGLGIFAARRTHLYRHIGSDNSLVPPNGLQYLVKQLGVGFE